MVDFWVRTALILLQAAVCNASYYCYYSYNRHGYVCNMSSGTIVGSAIGGIISLAFLVLICCCIGYRRRNHGTLIRTPGQRVAGVTVTSTTAHTAATQNYYGPQYQAGYNNAGFSPSYPAQPGYPPAQPGYPPAQPGYPPTQPAYPQAQPHPPPQNIYQPMGYQSPAPADAPPSYDSLQKY